MTAMMHHELVHKLIIIPRHKLLYTINDQGNLKKWANTKKNRYRRTYFNQHCLTLISEYCLSETFNATCDVDTVVLMMEATFGSMNTGRCSSSAHHCQQVK